MHLNSNRILCVLPVHGLVKLSLCIKMLQVLHLLLLHGIFPGWVGGAASLSSARTSMSLRFLGRRNATIGVSWGWLPSVFLRYVGWGGVFSVSWLCCGGWDGRSSQAAPFGWGFLVPWGRQCVGSGCTGGPLNLSVHAVFPITSGYQVCLQFSGSLLEVFVSGAYLLSLSAWL